MIDQQTIDKIRDTAQVLDVVSEFVTLRRRGQNYIGLCPFHSDKSPSFYVSPSKNICKCFSCGEGGDPVHFLMKHEQYNYMEALKWLARKYGIEFQEKEMTREEKEAQTAREGMLNLNDFAAKTFADDLFNSSEGRSVGLTYFRERGLQDDTIHRYGLGYALEKKDDFATRAMQKGHKRDFLLDPTSERNVGVGLCYGDDPRRTPVCRFAGRVIFPYYSISGRVVAFGGRILQRVDHAFKKYVNSPESAIYHKGDLLYGIFQAKGEIQKRDKCYIVEGNVDVLSMAQAGLPNTVASAGTALTTSQIRMIQRFTRNVVLMYDGDAAGIKASLRTIDLLLLEGMNVKLMLLPDGEDPDSFCRKHAASEVETFFNAHETDFISFKTHLLLQEAGNDPIKRAGILQNIVQSIALISDPLISSEYVRLCAQMLNASEAAVLDALKNQRSTNYANELRKYETEQRRAMAEAARREQDETSGKAQPSATAQASSVSDAATPTDPADDYPPEVDVDRDPYADRPIEAPSAVSSAPASAAYQARHTDRHELVIIKNIVRYGGCEFNYKWDDEQGNIQMCVMRVIDYYNLVLNQDEIRFNVPLYAKMLSLATEAAADHERPFDSVRFFSQHSDPEISRLALNLMEDRYNAFGIVQVEPQLDVLIPRAMLELQEAIVQQGIHDLNAQLRQPGADYRTIMEQLKKYNEMKTIFGKKLGERTVVW